MMKELWLTIKVFPTTTESTLKWLNILVSIHMRGQSVLHSVPFVAPWPFKPLLMCLYVSVKVVFFEESLECALIWSETQMFFYDFRKIPRLCKPSTFGPITCPAHLQMSHVLMLGQVSRYGKGFITFVAFEWFFQVCGQS